MQWRSKFHYSSTSLRKESILITFFLQHCWSNNVKFYANSTFPLVKSFTFSFHILFTQPFACRFSHLAQAAAVVVGTLIEFSRIKSLCGCQLCEETDKIISSFAQSFVSERANDCSRINLLESLENFRLSINRWNYVTSMKH